MWWRSTKVCGAKRRCGGPASRSELESLVLAPWAGRRRQDLLDILDQLTPRIHELTRPLEEEVEKRPVMRQLMTHPGRGSTDGLSLRVSDWNSRTLSLRETD